MTKEMIENEILIAKAKLFDFNKLSDEQEKRLYGLYGMLEMVSTKPYEDNETKKIVQKEAILPDDKLPKPREDKSQ